MKVCWITSCPPEHSGIAKYSQDIMSELKKLQSLEILRWNYDSWFARLFAPFTRLHDLRCALSNNDIVHVQYVLGEYLFFFLPVLCLIKRKGRAKIVITLHEDYTNLRFSWLFVWFHNIFYSCADLLLVHTPQHRSILAGKLQKHAHVIDFGVNPHKFGYAAKRNTVLLQGFINPWKGHDTAIRAINEVRLRIPDVRLIISGKPYDESYTRNIKSLTEQLGLAGNVQFIEGFIPESEYRELLASSEICILPYARITMSAVLSDVIGFAKPCVLSDLPAFRHYTQDKALYFKPGDHKMLASRIVLLLKRKGLRQKMQQDFAVLAQEYSWKNVARITLNGYRGLLE
jgi:glycosyltransferase involved in cell wall biosynthesis